MGFHSRAPERGWYLRHGGHETGGHTDGPQALTSSKEVSGGEHRVKNPTVVRGEGIDGGERKEEGENGGTKESSFSAPPRSDRDVDRIGGLMSTATRVHSCPVIGLRPPFMELHT